MSQACEDFEIFFLGKDLRNWFAELSVDMDKIQEITRWITFTRFYLLLQDLLPSIYPNSFLFSFILWGPDPDLDRGYRIRLM